MEYDPVQTFLTEAEELLANIEHSALSLGEDQSPAERVNQLFRAFHTIKGSGAMCGLEKVSGFTHHVETLLDKVREGSLAASPELGDLVLAAADTVRGSSQRTCPVATMILSPQKSGGTTKLTL